jgi:transcriptional regulator with XRE-family HTH domain
MPPPSAASLPTDWGRNLPRCVLRRRIDAEVVLTFAQQTARSTPGESVNRGPNAIDNHVGARVRMRRLMLDLTQMQLADALKLTFQQVQKYEKGTNRISASRLHQLSHILHVPVPFFFEGAPRELHLPELAEGGDTIASDLGAFLATSDGVALVKAYTRIEDPKVRRAIVALVEQIVAEPAARAGTVPNAPAVVAIK